MGLLYLFTLKYYVGKKKKRQMTGLQCKDRVKGNNNVSLFLWMTFWLIMTSNWAYYKVITENF